MSKENLTFPYFRYAKVVLCCSRGVPNRVDAGRLDRCTHGSEQRRNNGECNERQLLLCDLKQQLQQRLHVLLQNPVDWNGLEPIDDDKQHIFDAIAEDLSRRMLDLASRRVKSERLGDWRSAYDESGPRSTFRRARLIAERVYDLAAPVPGVTPSPDRNAFLQDVATVTREAVESVGATLH